MKMKFINSSLVFSKTKELMVKTSKYQNWFNEDEIPAGKYQVEIVSAEKEWAGNAVCGFTTQDQEASSTECRALFLYAEFTAGIKKTITLSEKMSWVYTYTPNADNNITFKIVKIG
jgi:hypothetical protein